MRKIDKIIYPQAKPRDIEPRARRPSHVCSGRGSDTKLRHLLVSQVNLTLYRPFCRIPSSAVIINTALPSVPLASGDQPSLHLKVVLPTVEVRANSRPARNQGLHPLPLRHFLPVPLIPPLPPVSWIRARSHWERHRDLWFLALLVVSCSIPQILAKVLGFDSEGGILVLAVVTLCWRGEVGGSSPPPPPFVLHCFSCTLRWFFRVSFPHRASRTPNSPPPPRG